MRKPLIWGVALGVLVLLITDAVATRSGLVGGAIPRTEGPWAWTSSRAAGIAAYFALALDVIFGLFISTGSADRWIARARTIEIHQWLSAATLTLVAAHVLLLLGDGFVRFDALDAIVPFIAPYSPVAVGLGVLAAYGAFAVHWSFSLRRMIGGATWRKLHYLTFVVFLLATAHGVIAGTDARLPWIGAMYPAAASAVTALLVYRFFPMPRKLARAGTR
jgi:predicted ferric reductase